MIMVNWSVGHGYGKVISGSWLWQSDQCVMDMVKWSVCRDYGKVISGFISLTVKQNVCQVSEFPSEAYYDIYLK